ncbi:hypothetical protein AB4090_08015 [Acidithiobacillus sp. IBUN Pt1247-S3]|uniref:hypothetical protein n=1 Tax=Acidithiobacillus sp. IBUN Pt1247-S3 TaxID=3166642 RepID=UPI0034E474A5
MNNLPKLASMGAGQLRGDMATTPMGALKGSESKERGPGRFQVPEDGVQDLANLLRYADQALYRAKALRGERAKYWVFHQDSRFGLRLEQRTGLLTEREEE